jgi:hypothetical protein
LSCFYYFPQPKLQFYTHINNPLFPSPSKICKRKKASNNATATAPHHLTHPVSNNLFFPMILFPAINALIYVTSNCTSKPLLQNFRVETDNPADQINTAAAINNPTARVLPVRSSTFPLPMFAAGTVGVALLLDDTEAAAVAAPPTSEEVTAVGGVLAEDEGELLEEDGAPVDGDAEVVGDAGEAVEK